jgi:hypothetical protein
VSDIVRTAFGARVVSQARLTPLRLEILTGISLASCLSRLTPFRREGNAFDYLLANPDAPPRLEVRLTGCAKAPVGRGVFASKPICLDNGAGIVPPG